MVFVAIIYPLKNLNVTQDKCLQNIYFVMAYRQRTMAVYYEDEYDR